MEQVKLSAAAKAKVTSWLNNVQPGDRIVFSRGGVSIYNESGCEIDYVATNATK